MTLLTRIILTYLLLTVLPASLMAAGMPITYSRTSIAINRKTLPPVPPPLPWQKQTAPVVVDPRVKFDVEVRDAVSLYKQKGWFSLSGPTDNKGVLMLFDVPSMAPIVHTTQYTPMDILLADSEGKITQIIPSIKLSDLDQDIMPSNPILGFLFLRSGTCAELSITPGDRIEYPAFRRGSAEIRTEDPTQPVIITSASPAKVPATKNTLPTPNASGPVPKFPESLKIKPGE